MRKKCKIIIYVIALIIVFIIVALIVDVNVRFPKAKTNVASCNSWLELSDFRVKVESAKLINGNEVLEQDNNEYEKYSYLISKSKDKAFLDMMVTFENICDTQLNLRQLSQLAILESLPDGWRNQVFAISVDDEVLLSGECKSVKMLFLINVNENNINEFMKKNSFYLTFSLYPIKNMSEVEVNGL